MGIPFKVVEKHPERVVWIYSQQIRTRKDRLEWAVFVGTDDGKKHVHRLGKQGSRQEAEVLVAHVAGKAPRAYVGYEPKIQQYFTRDPHSLRLLSK